MSPGSGSGIGHLQDTLPSPPCWRTQRVVGYFRCVPDLDRRVIDPSGLTRLAARLRRDAEDAETVLRTLHSLQVPGESTRLRRLLDWAADCARGIDRAAARARELDTMPDVFAGLALYGLPGREIYGLDPAITDLQAQTLRELIAREGTPEATSEAVRRFFTGLTPAEQAALVATDPTMIGSLNGAPHTLRYAANRALIERELRKELLVLAALGTNNNPNREYAAARVARLTEFLQPREVKTRTGYESEERRFLLFDPSGDGKVAEVFGNLDSAHNVAVSVPGVTNRLDNFDEYSQGVHDLYATARNAGKQDVAAVAWLGYDTPGIVDGLLPDAAQVGGPALHAFRAGLNTREDARTTLIAHSYGTRVSATALQTGAVFDNVIFMGGPGFAPGVSSVADLRLPGDTRVYAMRARGDYVSYAHFTGPDPARFPDITRLDTSGGPTIPTGHSQYFMPETGSLANLSAVAWGIGTPRPAPPTTPAQEAWWAPAEEVLLTELLKRVPPEERREFVARMAPHVRDLTEIGRARLDPLWLAYVLEDSDLLDFLTPEEFTEAVTATAGSEAYRQAKLHGASDTVAWVASTEATAATRITVTLPVQAASRAQLYENTYDASVLAARGAAEVAERATGAADEAMERAVDAARETAERIAERVRQLPVPWPFGRP
ncbi:MAG: hypothetical protein GEV11_05295 [Streptosporangiales bacterium]|nr:hypothetical protein [Streptosporangiales bacterium]